MIAQLPGTVFSSTSSSYPVLPASAEPVEPAEPPRRRGPGTRAAHAEGYRYNGAMYADWYANISAPFRSPRAARVLNVLDKGLVYAIAACYAGLLAYLAASGDARAVRFAAAPAATFAATTLLRAAIDAPRPYERYGIDPIIRKNTKGKSLPSRHISSAMAIACALCWIHPGTGIAGFAATAAVGACRIVGGVHFPRDVTAAALLAAAFAFVGYVLVP